MSNLPNTVYVRELNEQLDVLRDVSENDGSGVPAVQYVKRSVSEKLERGAEQLLRDAALGQEDLPDLFKNGWRTVGEHGMPDCDALWTCRSGYDDPLLTENMRIQKPRHPRAYDCWLPLSELLALRGGES